MCTAPRKGPGFNPRNTGSGGVGKNTDRLLSMKHCIEKSSLESHRRYHSVPVSAAWTATVYLRIISFLSPDETIYCQTKTICLWPHCLRMETQSFWSVRPCAQSPASCQDLKTQRRKDVQMQNGLTLSQSVSTGRIRVLSQNSFKGQGSRKWDCHGEWSKLNEERRQELQSNSVGIEVIAAWRQYRVRSNILFLFLYKK